MKTFYLISSIVCALLFITCISLVIFGIATSQRPASIILNVISGCTFAFGGGTLYLCYKRE